MLAKLCLTCENVSVLNPETYENLQSLADLEPIAQQRPNPEFVNDLVEGAPITISEERLATKAIVAMGQLSSCELPDYPRENQAKKLGKPTALSDIGAMFTKDRIVLRAINARRNIRPEATPYESIGIYLKDIGSFTLLTKEEEIDFGKKMDAAVHIFKEYDEECPDNPADLFTLREGAIARQVMILSNLRLLVNLARRLQPTIKGASGMDLQDVIGEGSPGLITAVEKFDWRKNFKFSTYATWWIRQSIQRGVADNHQPIRIPTHMVDRIKKYTEAQQILKTAFRREPTFEEIAERCGEKNVDKVEDALFINFMRVDSLDSPLDSRNSSDEYTRQDTIPDTQVQLDEELLKEVTNHYLDKLLQSAGATDKEKFIISKRNGIDLTSLANTKLLIGTQLFTYEEIIDKYGSGKMTLKTLGEIFGVTRERIRQIEGKASGKIERYVARTGETYEF